MTSFKTERGWLLPSRYTGCAVLTHVNPSTPAAKPLLGLRCCFRLCAACSASWALLVAAVARLSSALYIFAAWMILVILKALFLLIGLQSGSMSAAGSLCSLRQPSRLTLPPFTPHCRIMTTQQAGCVHVCRRLGPPVLANRNSICMPDVSRRPHGFGPRIALLHTAQGGRWQAWYALD